MSGPRRKRDPDDLSPTAAEPAPAPGPAPPTGPAAVLALQQSAGNAAVTRALTDQEQSWANPATVAAADPALVGTVYFRTKDWVTDSQDEAVLARLAKAYAGFAMRSGGLRGQVIGYADPRPSIEPDNPALAAQRAEVVARRLVRHLIAETHGLIEGDFDVRAVGGGVAPADAELTAGPENLTPLGRLRRAEIYLTGQAGPAEPAPAPPSAPIPEDAEHDDGWERWIPLIEGGDKRTVEGVSGQILAFLAYRGKFVRDVFSNTGKIPLPDVKLGASKFKTGSITYGEHGGTLPFRPRKPDDWDRRTDARPQAALGRAALSPEALRKHTMIVKALRMVDDMRRLNLLIDRTIGDDRKAYLAFMEELRKDTPDVAKLKEYAVPIQELMFVMDALKDEAVEVSRLAQ